MKTTLPATFNRKHDLPVDRGWAWVICAAVFANHYIISNSFQVLAVSLLDLTEEFNTSLTTVSLILMVKTLCMSVTSIVSVNFLVPRFGLRQVLTLSGLVYFVCGVCYAFTPNVEIFIVLATIRGIAIGCINLPAVNLLGFYFKKHRSIATTIAICGASVSAISWPRLARYIISFYDLQGTLLLNGALEGHMILTALLLRPVASYRSEPDIDASSSLTKEDCKEGNGNQPSKNQNSNVIQSTENDYSFKDPQSQRYVTENNIKGNEFSKSTPLLEEYKEKQCSSTDQNTNNLVERENMNNSHVPQKKRPFPGSNSYCNSHKQITQLHHEVFSEDPSENIINEKDLQGKDEKGVHHKSLKSCPDVFALANGSGPGHDAPYRHGDGISYHNSNKDKRLLYCGLQTKSSSTSCIDNELDKQIRYTSVSNLGSVLDFGHGVLPPEHDSESPTKMWHKIHLMFDFSLFKQWAFLWLLIASFPCGTNSFVFTYLPTMATLKGVSKDDGALLLTILGALDLGSRMVMGLIADTKYFKMSTLIGFCCVCLGTIFLFVEFYNDLSSLIAMSVALGLFVGIRSTLITVLFIEVFGLEKMAKAFSMFTVFITLSVSGHGPLLGHMMESLGVNAVMYYMGFSMIVGGVVIYTLPLVLRLEKTGRGTTQQ